MYWINARILAGLTRETDLCGGTDCLPLRRGQGKGWGNAALVAWVIGWVGDHDWSALLRLVVLILAFAVAGTILLGTICLIRGI